MDKQKKKRDENWDPEEKTTLRQIVSESAHIIENKSNKSNINILKAKEWRMMTTRFNEITGKNRSENQLKLAWKRMKLAAKANLSSHRQQQYLTGGGEKPPSPSPDDLAVMAITPYDFVIDVNNYDSDAVQVVVSAEFDPHKENIKSRTSNDPSVLREIDPLKLNKETSSVTPEEAKSHSESNIINKCKQNKKAPQKTNQDMRESIAESNKNFKEKHLEMLQEEHTLNVKIAQLKTIKLELEIALLQKFL